VERLDARRAAALLRPVDSFAVPLGPGQPAALLHALSERDDFEQLRVFGALLLDAYPLFASKGVCLYTAFMGPAERALRDAGHDVRFVPGDFRRFSGMLEDLAPRVMATAVAPPGPDGCFSLSLHAGATVQALRRCGRDPGRVLVAEVNRALPRTQGLPPEHPHHLRPEEIDVLVEGDRPPKSLDEDEPGEVERAIAAHALALIPERATLQTGIGAVPSAVVGLLAEGEGEGYGIHSEMFTTALMRLQRAGKVDNLAKGIYEGFSVCTFALGSEELHRWLDGRDDVRFLPVELVNEPSVIARNRRMVSINGALSIDLAGQVVADTIDGRQHSGIGGHEDFVGGASLERDDRSLVCLPATVRVGGRILSRIQAKHPRGAIITTPRHQLDVVVTEYGAAELRGRTDEERARALVSIAHPALREALMRGEPDLALPG
jgi:acyl-CoA hydrolase